MEDIIEGIRMKGPQLRVEEEDTDDEAEGGSDSDDVTVMDVDNSST